MKPVIQCSGAQSEGKASRMNKEASLAPAGTRQMQTRAQTRVSQRATPEFDRTIQKNLTKHSAASTLDRKAMLAV